ncbi:ammonium transporter [Beggiatoa leptomitoformis]|uniref:Ammonium transporter n=1 Tax=Beggiatoa leptomitoformis TaxID=288004 RepID=A0A2N9YHY3_9GAMM|nr:ammonium transporter [Beggiatoa leptomitoformis]ALG67670.1 ammonium transporter [Beggiatoa leptomitoformis]AUI70094.1 ammonium transporter [Beggiatoa leptomitoformis]
MKKTLLQLSGMFLFVLLSHVALADDPPVAPAPTTPAVTTEATATPAPTPTETVATPVETAVPAPAPVAEAPKVDKSDIAWIMTSAALVLLMTPGLALFYGGLVRTKNALNMFMKVFVSMGLISVLWVVIGYSIAFQPNNPFFGGIDWMLLKNVGLTPHDFYATSIPHQLFMVFQMMFAIITVALIAGAVAERMKFGSFVIFMGIWSLVVYAPLAHMVWGQGGYLFDMGALDFAGGAVVHISSGFSGLMLAIILGKRKINHNDDVRPHNLPFTLVGMGLLWFGWFGFNAGSAVASNELAVSAFVVTQIACGTAALTWLLLESLVYGKPTALGFASGAVAGLVAITPAAGFVNVTGALILGVTVPIVCLIAIRLKHKLGYDDTLDAFGIHGVGGVWGAVLTGVLADPSINPLGKGLMYGGEMSVLTTQFISVGIAIGMALVGTFIIAFIIKLTIGLRVDDESEQSGLDVNLHGEMAYSRT